MPEHTLGTHTPPVVGTCCVEETGLSVAPDSKQRCEATTKGAGHRVGYIHPSKHKLLHFTLFLPHSEELKYCVHTIRPTVVRLYVVTGYNCMLCVRHDANRHTKD